MRKIVLGLLAHVDAGKTTLAEAMLFQSGVLRNPGRVDHGNTVMDYHHLEQDRGITIFTGQAIMRGADLQLTLMDTPGHVDFSAEMERTLQIMDYAVLVISGTDGIQAHTITLWRLLKQYHIPVFIFVTKMDFARRSEQDLMAELKKEFGTACVDFSDGGNQEYFESIALCREDILETYLETGSIEDELIAETIRSGQIFPCYFGSGLKGEGIGVFLRDLNRFLRMPISGHQFGARVFKINRDDNGNRLTHLKMTGGDLAVRQSIFTGRKEEKNHQIRLYSGKKYETADRVSAGDVCAVVGWEDTFGGQGLGCEYLDVMPVLESMMNYRIVLPDGCDPETVFPKLKELEEEDPQLKMTWHSDRREIHVALMGEVQTEIIKSLIAERFGIEVEIDSGHVLYKETIANTVEGVGHYEPLRHYAEVHLLLSPLPAGSGLVFGSVCDEDALDRNWQRLILTHLAEKKHLGVLTGSPITDMKIVLAAGRAHLKHTEGGDFRQATYRAVRQGLMQAESRLLEPYYAFRLNVPSALVGRAMNDIRARYGEFETLGEDNGMMTLKGIAPVTTFNDYVSEVASYTGGRGRLVLAVSGYGPCHNADEVIAAAHYDPEADTENSPHSVFCVHGGGFSVNWKMVPQQMHLPSCLPKQERQEERVSKRHFTISDQEMREIMRRLYGEVKETQTIYRPSKRYAEEASGYCPNNRDICYIVDGYNVLFSWKSLSKLTKTDIAAARDSLIRILSDFSAFEKCRIILVFDGHHMPGNQGERQLIGDVEVIFTKEGQSADAYIERLIYEIGKNDQVYAVTSDALIQQTAVQKGILRMPVREFEQLIQESHTQIGTLMRQLAQNDQSQTIKALLTQKKMYNE